MVAITKAERTRQYIIEQAAHLFNQRGYAGTSLQDIMAATGLTKGGIYGHFESKEEIALAAFKHASAIILQLLSQTIKAHFTATAKLEALLDFYKKYIISPPITGGCPVLNTSVEADDTNPLLRASVVKVLNKMHRSLEGIVQQGIQQGEFKTTVNAEQFSILFISMIEGGVMVSKAYGKPHYLHTVLKQLHHMIQEMKN
ncbi:TetR/AcrR family transcriptional regulator [Pontibacter sp. KCTC 32443]|uniref:TetR/AcrR family transcriptional regulator n=1 Tax=Pontibacter TaxID=323449 RepID=UPI00164DD2BF|nr:MULTISPECIES: TetR/AcrR family transcriptional regulator [Pontibacter]MBC5772616.1 TetR/AcrR family transcriptional regulator [Pontibacter sp. KCTC 32443]